MSTRCDATGKLPCPACEGRGYHASPHIAPDLFTIYDCGNCKGTGRRATCPGCEKCEAAKDRRAERAARDGQGRLF
jgi:DnaJ-class molecular chaperone